MSYQAIFDKLELSAGKPEAPFLDPVNHPIITAVNVVSEVLLEILGPLLWAALIYLCLIAELSST